MTRLDLGEKVKDIVIVQVKYESIVDWCGKSEYLKTIVKGWN